MAQYYLRGMYVAPKDKVLVNIDLSQAESWIVAYLADEQNMKWSLLNSNIHTDTAAALFYTSNPCLHNWDADNKCNKCGLQISKVERYIGKRWNHASGYRMKYPKAAAVVNADSDKPPYVTVTLTESKMYSELWHERYNVKTWWANIEHKLNTQNRTLKTVYGFKRTFFAQWGEELFREATAFEPQSTVADHFNGAIHPELGVKGGLVEIYRQLIMPYREHKIVNQSHDSCMLELPRITSLELAMKAMDLLKRPLVINGEQFVIPVDGEIGDRWENMEKI